MNPKSCEMALVGMVKSVGGVTASNQGGRALFGRVGLPVLLVGASVSVQSLEH